jgi:hypothetical protein
MSYNNPTKTVAEVGATVKRMFGDESGVQLVDNDIVVWTNQAQQEIANSTKVLKAKAVTAITAGTDTYTLSGVSPTILQIESLLVDGRRIGNMSVAQAEESISQADPLAEESGFPAFWYEWAGEITFWPVPAQDATMTIRYTANPAVLTAVSDTLSIPDDYFTDVVNFVLKQAYEMDENENMMTVKAREFEGSMQELGDEERTAQNMTYETLTVYDLY